jgi:ribosome-associated protein
VLEQLAEDGVRPERSEGTALAGWILLDYGAVIVHVMNVEQRAFYRLEELWSEAQTLLAIQ